MQGLADRTGLASLSRFVDGIVVAVERGTPLAEVLLAQAQDVRESGRRAVMEEGGRKEIAMMIPCSIPIRRYRYRGNVIPNPFTSRPEPSPTAALVESPVR